ncbi:SGNH/GDSL hydrolase family protein [Acidisoma sp.]|uniref:SGNH/GDSL hydrolase family protein n=1 Tax=Acidisoma sp. TaxID=1872115 RepID=UPI003B00570B
MGRKQRIGFVIGVAGVATALVLAKTSPTAAQQATPTERVHVKIVSFGDSLSDVGTYAPFASRLFNGGRFTTNPGTIWTQQIASYYGDVLRPAFVGGFGHPLTPEGGFGYAEGGSRVALQPGIGEAAAGTPDEAFALQTAVPIKEQVSTFLSQHHNFASNQLVLINGGANDLFFNLGRIENDPLKLPLALIAIEKAAIQLGELVQRIHRAGGQHIVVMDLADFSKAPLAQKVPVPKVAIQAVILGFNETLKVVLFAHGLLNKVVLIDAFSFMNQVVAQGQALGFRTTSGGSACNAREETGAARRLGLHDPSIFSDSLFCSPATYSEPKADGDYMFADTVHPTTHFSLLLAQYVEQQIATSRSTRGLGRLLLGLQ